MKIPKRYKSLQYERESTVASASTLTLFLSHVRVSSFFSAKNEKTGTLSPLSADLCVGVRVSYRM